MHFSLHAMLSANLCFHSIFSLDYEKLLCEKKKSRLLTYFLEGAFQEMLKYFFFFSRPRESVSFYLIAKKTVLECHTIESVFSLQWNVSRHMVIMLYRKYLFTIQRKRFCGKLIISRLDCNLFLPHSIKVPDS